MKRIIFTIVLLTLCSFNLFAQRIVTKEEYKIYASVLGEIYKEELRNIKEGCCDTRKKIGFIILNETHTIGNTYIPEDSKAEKIDLDLETIKWLKKYTAILRKTKVEENFDIKNKVSMNLQRLFPVNYQYSLVNKTEIDRLLEIGRKDFDKVEEERKLGKGTKVYEGSGLIWKPFYEQYRNANGYYQFSRIGFSPGKSWALVEVAWENGECSSSLRYLLKKIKGKWIRHTISGGGGCA